MRRDILRFWASALAVAIGFAVATAQLFPYEALRLRTGPERWEVWLLTLWCGGVMAILFGLAGLFGVAAPLGIREVTEAGSVAAAVEARRTRRRAEGGFHSNFAWWLVTTGALMVGIYFIAWTLGR